jgi:hypothetical protein
MRMSMDSVNSAKSAALKMKVKVKGRNSAASKKSLHEPVLNSHKLSQNNDSIFE